MVAQHSQPAGALCKGRWEAVPAALLSRAAAEGLARSVGHEAGVTWVAGGVRLPLQQLHRAAISRTRMPLP